MTGARVLFDIPGPKARRRNHILTAITVLVIVGVGAAVLSALYDKGQLAERLWAPLFTANVWTTYLIPGIKGTLLAAAISIVLALILGFLLGIGRLSTVAPLRWFCSVFVEFFRAVPVLIMMIFAFFLFGEYRFDVFGIPFVPPQYQALAGVVTGLTLYNGAVIAEIVRAGVNSLPRGQTEAAQSLGMRAGQTMRAVLLPQAITSMLPVLISQMVVVLKDTAIGYQITYVEMVRQGRVVGANLGNFIPSLIVIAVLMITFNFLLSALAVSLEKRLRRSARAPRPLDPAKIEQEGAAAAKVQLSQIAEQSRGGGGAT